MLYHLPLLFSLLSVSSAAPSCRSCSSRSLAEHSTLHASIDSQLILNSSATRNAKSNARILPLVPGVSSRYPIIHGPIVSGYYPAWASDTLPPEKINFAKYHWIDFAFATPDANYNLTWDDPLNSPNVLRRLVIAAHAHGTKVKLSIGGWDGSRHVLLHLYFSAACADAAARRTFVHNIVAMYSAFSLDGIDIDWEYPGQQGAPSTQVNHDDSANLLLFLKLLRYALPREARITAAVQDKPFAATDGTPMKDVSDYAALLDWVIIMNYDVFASSNTPGPNAPLSDGCHNVSHTVTGLNAQDAIRAWTDAQFPAGRLMLGVPFYGYINRAATTHLSHKRTVFAFPRQQFLAPSGTHATRTIGADDNQNLNSPVQPSDGGDRDDQNDSGNSSAGSSSGLVTIVTRPGSSSEGQISFFQLVSQGALLTVPASNLNATLALNSTDFIGYNGFTRFWDACSSTPFLASPYVSQVITYDDPQSLAMKAYFAKEASILGIAAWDISGDTPQGDLVSTLWETLGVSST